MARRKEPRPEDIAFKAEFGRKLTEKYNKWSGTDQEFADALDVTRPTLKDYLSGNIMPGLRTVVRAWNLGVYVRYGNFNPKKLVAQARGSKKTSDAQLLLPLAIDSLGQEDVQVELAGKKPNSIALNVTIKFAS